MQSLISGIPAATLIVAVALLFPAAGSAVAAGDPACTLYASTSGSASAPGTFAAPYASPQQLLDALKPGQTGCVRGGTYALSSLRASHGGSASAPLTLMSYPGEHATISIGSEVYVPKGSDYTAFRNLTLAADPGSSSVSLDMIQDLGNYTTWESDDISAGSRVTCMIIGLQISGYVSQPVGTVINGNRIHDCGSRANGNQQHAIYVDNARSTRITNNVIINAAAYGVHMYPDADGVTVAHNVIVGSGWGGIVWASDDSNSGLRDDNDEAYANIIANGDQFGLDVRWTSGQGSGNSAHDNCLYANHSGSYNGSLAGVATSNNLTADPGFVNAAAGDYSLKSGSPCLALVGYDTAALVAAGVPPSTGGGSSSGGGSTGGGTTTGGKTTTTGKTTTGKTTGGGQTTGGGSGTPGTTTPAQRAARALSVAIRVKRHRRTLVLHGTVAPARSGWWVVARKRSGANGWRTVGRARLTKLDARRSAYRLKLARPRHTIRVRLEIVRPGTQRVHGLSRVVRVQPY